ncbi:MAG: hypothetical protein FWG72_07890 [Oscillospiraceae bacterium]|nr:hypothetical protein [Oscillospiraceae bacterium]
MNRRQFKADMEAAWELRPGGDGTPCSGAHHNRFARPRDLNAGWSKTGEKTSPAEKKRENGS